VAGAVVRYDPKLREVLEGRLVDGLGNDGKRFDIATGLVQRPILDVAKLIPGRARETASGENFQGWRRGLEPPTTGTTTRGSTN
jgi:hypothetical protein